MNEPLREERREEPQMVGRRASDDLIIRLDQRFTDFLGAYERDREDAARWRGGVESRLSTIERVLAEIQPNYRRILAAMGFVVTGCITAVGVFIWKHVSGGR